MLSGCSQLLLRRSSKCRTHGQATGAIPRPARGPVVAATWASTSCWRRPWCRWCSPAPWTVCKTPSFPRAGSSATMMQSMIEGAWALRFPIDQIVNQKIQLTAIMGPSNWSKIYIYIYMYIYIYNLICICNNPTNRWPKSFIREFWVGTSTTL